MGRPPTRLTQRPRPDEKDAWRPGEPSAGGDACIVQPQPERHTQRLTPQPGERSRLIREAEGVALVLDQDQADSLELPYTYIAAMIILRVHSSLDAVGLTADVARQLATGGISCNVVAGYFHDHLFVPIDKADLAVNLLRDLTRAST
jgi:hypothetical protein